MVRVLSLRQMSVCIRGESSSETRLDFGVPQGSVLEPIMFILYTGPIADIARRHSLQAHFYTDDSQLYVAFSPLQPGDEETIAGRVKACLYEIRNGC